MRGVLFVLICSLGWCAAVAAPRAETPPGSPASGEAATSVPTEEEVLRLIKELGSARDFDRLRWILDAAEEQVPPIRAKLLKALDDQMQELVRAEVEARTETVLAALQPNVTYQRGSEAPASGTIGPPTFTPGEPLPPPQPETPISVETMAAEIDGTSWAADPQEQVKQVAELSKKVLSVADPQQREALRKRITEHRLEAMGQDLETRRAEVMKRLEAPAQTQSPP